MGKVIDLNNMEVVFDAMVEEQAKQCRREKDSAEDNKVKMDTVGVLAKFKNYITSARFKAKCFFEAKNKGTSYEIIRHKYIRGILGKIADILGLTIEITGEIILYAVKFIANLINSVVNLAVTLVKKIISLFTLNCGEHCHA
jgi:hypothetical protein